MSHALTESTYGSDKAGLVCADAFTPGRPGRAIDSDEAAAVLASGSEGESLWLHFTLTNTATARWLRQHTALPDVFFESHDTSSTRLEVVDEALMGVLNDVQFFAVEAWSASTVTLHVAKRLMVSARTTPLRAIDRLRASVKGGELFTSPAELLAHLLRDQAGVLVDIVRDATRQVGIEDRIIRHQRTSRPKLGVLRRVLVRLQRLLAPEPAALFRLLNRPPPWLSESDLGELRQSAEELAAAVADSVALVERVRLLHAVDAERTVWDTIEFDNAVAVALAFAERTNTDADPANDTLVIVTADHECGGLGLIGVGNPRYAPETINAAVRDYAAVFRFTPVPDMTSFPTTDPTRTATRGIRIRRASCCSGGPPVPIASRTGCRTGWRFRRRSIPSSSTSGAGHTPRSPTPRATARMPRATTHPFAAFGSRASWSRERSRTARAPAKPAAIRRLAT